jgi:hypothetical protein
MDLEYYVKLLIICIQLVLSKVIRKVFLILKKLFLIRFNSECSYTLFSVPFSVSVTYRH